MFTCLKRAAVFLLGFYTLIAQVIFLREFLVIFFGNELCLGIIFAGWFLGVGIGAAVCNRAARRVAGGEMPFLSLFSVLLILSPVITFSVRVLKGILRIPAGEYISIAWLLGGVALLIIPFSFFIGFIFPMACLLSFGEGEKNVRNIGRIYILESAGSMCGGILFSFYLAGQFSVFSILLGLGLVILPILFLLSLERGLPGGARRLFAILAIFYACAGLCGAAHRLEDLSVRMRWRSLNPNLPLVESVDTRYENIAMARREEQYDVFGDGQYYFSFPDPYGTAGTVHMIMSEHPDPKTVLLLGGGIGGTIRELLSYGLARLDYVELDPALIRLTEKHLPPEDSIAMRNPAVRVHYGDGRHFVKETEERYDVIIANVPEPSTAMLNRFYTREFFEEAKRILNPRGVFVTHLSTPSDYYGEEVGNYATSVYVTLASVFPHVLVTATEEKYFFAACAPGVITSDIDALQRRWEERKIATDYFTPYHLAIWWLPERVEFTRKALESRSARKLNTDFTPVTYYFNLILWARFSGSGIAGLLDALEKVSWYWYLVPILVFFFACFLYMKFGSPRQMGFHALLAIGVIGFTAMAMEMTLIFAFQSAYGYVYGMIGMIVALFMAGLAGGGYTANNLIAIPGGRYTLWLGGIECGLAAFALLIPVILKQVTSPALYSSAVFMALIFITGFATGMGFPLASRIYMGDGADLRRAAARVNASDHLGACAGSLLTGVLFIPLLGISASCIIIAVLNAAAGLLVLACRDQR